MKLTKDESRALTFLAALLALSALIRLAGTPEPAGAPAAAMDLDAHAAATGAAVDSARLASTPLGPDERLDPNTAPVVQLDRLPRVGPALARRIVEDRAANGPFRSPADLARVSGIGEAMVAAMAPHLEVRRGGAAALAAGSGSGRTGGAAGRGDGRTARPGHGPGGTVDVNRADAESLTALPGIGPVLAARIVAWRDSAGPFPDVDALVAVPGVGEATLERFRSRVRAGY